MAIQAEQAPTIYDIARTVGVSAGTVSRVLNRRGRVSPATRQRVLKAAHRANFRPRVVARQITIAVITDKARYAAYGGYVACMINHLTQELAKRDVTIELFTEQNFERLNERLVDGLISLCWDQATLTRLRQMQKKAHIPVVLFSQPAIEGISSVTTDYIETGQQAARCLLDRGHRRVGFIAESKGYGMNLRLEGMRREMAERGLPAEYLVAGYTQHQPMAPLLRRLLSQQPRPTALFVASEDLVLESVSELADGLGLKIPEDISIVAMENANVSQYARPPLTSIAMPYDQLANEGLDLLMSAMLAGKPADSCIVPTDFIERGSVHQIAEPVPRLSASDKPPIAGRPVV